MLSTRTHAHRIKRQSVKFGILVLYSLFFPSFSSIVVLDFKMNLRALDLLSVSQSNPSIHPPYWFSSSCCFFSCPYNTITSPYTALRVTEWNSICSRQKAATHTLCIVYVVHRSWFIIQLENYPQSFQTRALQITLSKFCWKPLFWLTVWLNGVPTYSLLNL